MWRRRVCAVFVCFLLCLLPTLPVRGAYLAAEPVEESYVAQSVDFEAGLPPELTFAQMKYELQSGLFGNNTQSLPLSTDTVRWQLGESSGLFGKTELSFRFATDRLSAPAEITFLGALPGGVETKLFQFLIDPAQQIGVWKTFCAMVDTEAGRYRLTVSDRGEPVQSVDDAPFVGGLKQCLLTAVTVTAPAAGVIALDDLAARRSGFYPWHQPVVETHGALSTAAVRVRNDGTGTERFMLYLASYEEDALLKAVSTKEKELMPGQETVLETCLYDERRQLGDVVKSSVFTVPALGVRTDAASSAQGVLLSEGFEETNGRLPYGWRPLDYRDNQTVPLSCAVMAEGEGQCLSIDAADTDTFGAGTGILSFDPSADAYRVTCRMKSTADYSGNKPGVTLLFYSGGRFVSSVGGLASVRADSSGWTENVFELSAREFPKGEIDGLEIRFYSGRSGSREPSGALLVDDVTVTAVDANLGLVLVDMECEAFSAWHSPGESVVYRPARPFGEEFVTVAGTVFDAQGNAVDTVSAGTDDVMVDGWRWTPKETGFYTVQFTAADEAGNRLPVVSRVRYGERDYVLSYERSFVVAQPAKPIGERNASQFFTYQYITKSGGNLDELRRADLIGFSGLRVLAYNWGDSRDPAAGYPRALNPGRDEFYWGWTDALHESIDDYGFSVIADLLFTPQWASSHPEETDKVSDRYSLYKYGSYAPADLVDWEAFIRALAERYGDSIDCWEIWNEPNLPGKSIFWLDTPENYAALLKSAYTTIKSVDPDAPVAIGGLGGRSYLPFYQQLLTSTDAYSYFDVLALHGGEGNDARPFNDFAQSQGLAPKPYITTEAYFNRISSGDSEEELARSEQEMAVNMLKCYFREAKYGARATSLFEIDTRDPIGREVLPYIKTEGRDKTVFGVYRTQPFSEPRFQAMVLSTWFRMMGRSFRFENEYVFGAQQAVAFENDGSPMLALWNEQENFTADPALAACFAQDVKITDWQGRDVPVGETLEKNTVYFIENLDAAVLAALPASPGAVLHFG